MRSRLWVLGYGLGSIPFGLIITRSAGTADLRAIGSGNIGATNVLRTGRKDLAALTLVLDALKGTAAVLLARYILGDATAIFAGIGAFLGHIYPVWLGFRGGKGVATYLGCLIGLWWPAALGFAFVWLGVAVATRFSSAAALVASVIPPLMFVLTGQITDGVALIAMTTVLWWTHRANLQRLVQGTESRIGAKA